MPGVVSIIRASGETFSFDGELEIGFSPSVTLTSNPVEDGTTSTDHAIRQNDPINVTGVVTNSPFLPRGVAPTVGRTQAAAEFLEAILGERVTLVIASEQVSRSFDDVVLAEMPHTVGMLNSLEFACKFQRIRLVESQLVRIPPEQPRPPRSADEVDKRSTMPDAQDVGEQPPKKELPPEKAAEDDRSWFAQALDGDLF